MLKIYTDHTLSTRHYIYDIESEFNLDEPSIDTMYTDSLSVKVLQQLEGMTARNGYYIDSKFGTTSIMNISTGCKALLLCIKCHKDCIINTDEMGTNAIQLLGELAKTLDIEVVTHHSISCLPVDYECYINDEYCTGEDIEYALEELLDEEVI